MIFDRSVLRSFKISGLGVCCSYRRGAAHILGYSNTEPRNPPGYPFPFPLVPGWFNNQSQELRFQRHVKADLRVKQVAIVEVGSEELVCNGRGEIVVFVFV